jgi:membrane fusion protein (multidrug efflux system)
MTRQYGSIEAALKALPQPELQLSDGSLYEHKGKIESISGVIDSSTGSISLRAVFPNPGRLLHSGSTGNVVLRQQLDQCVIIPCLATYELQDLVFVYVVKEGKTVSRRVEVIKYDGVNYIVKSGLEPGEVIITEGVSMLREDTPVQLKSESPAPAAAPVTNQTEE